MACDKSKEHACAECGAPMTLMQMGGKLVYVCKHYPRCPGRVAAHPDGRMAGVPGTMEERKLRRQAHKLLSEVWPYNDSKSRKACYRWLSLNTRTGHIGDMHRSELLCLIKRIKAYKRKLERFKGGGK